MPHFNIADLALALLWLYCSFRGYLRGLVKEIGSLAAIALGFYCAGTYHNTMAPNLTPYISGNYAGTAAYLIIFTVTLLGVWFLTLAVSGVVKITMTEWANRFFGGAFGLLKGVLITAVILFLIQLAAPHPDFLKGSRLVPVLEQFTSRFVRYIPPDIHQKLRAWTKNIPAGTAPADKPKTLPRPNLTAAAATPDKAAEAKKSEPAKAATAKPAAAPAGKPSATARKKTPAPTAGAEKHHE